MIILVTGCAGYIGSMLCDELVKNPKFQVIGMDNLIYNNISAITHLATIDNFTFYLDDVRSIGKCSTKDLYTRADIIIPLAAIVGAPACDRFKVEARAINFFSVCRMLKCLSKEQKVIFPNTNSGYGTNTDMCTEETEMNPLSHYAQTKCDAEDMVLEHPNSVVLRLATVFGRSHRMRFDLMVNDFVKRAIYDQYIELYEPNFKRNFIHIKDVTKAFIHSILSPLKGVYNVGNDQLNCTKEDLVEYINTRIPFTWTIKEQTDPDQRNYTVSSKKFYSTGFKCRYSFLTGVEEIENFCHYNNIDKMNKMTNLHRKN